MLTANTVKVDRSTKWGNPFRSHDPETDVWLFRKLLTGSEAWSPIPAEKWPKGKMPATFTTLDDVRRDLRGKNLACWCKPGQPCHADLLLEIANK